MFAIIMLFDVILTSAIFTTLLFIVYSVTHFRELTEADRLMELELQYYAYLLNRLKNKIHSSYLMTLAKLEDFRSPVLNEE